MTQIATRTSTATTPRFEAVEMSDALGLENISYSETQTPTLSGKMGNRFVTIQKRTTARPQRSLARKAFRTMLREMMRKNLLNAVKIGQRLANEWVIVHVEREAATAVPDVALRAAASPVPGAVPQVPLEYLARGAGLHLEEQRSYTAGETQAALDDARARGQGFLLSLISEGALVQGQVVADAWGITPQALGLRKRAGAVVGVMVNNRLLYPASLSEFPTRDDAERVCARLKDLPPVEALVLLRNAHSRLGSRTIAQALAEGAREMVDEFLSEVAERE